MHDSAMADMHKVCIDATSKMVNVLEMHCYFLKTQAGTGKMACLWTILKLSMMMMVNKSLNSKT